MNNPVPGEQRSADKPFSASKKMIHTWALGAWADYWMYCQFGCIMLVYTTGFKMDARWVSLVLLFPRIFDGLIDPFIGHLSDITHTKWGRRRPFLFATTFIGALMSVLVWMPSTAWPQWVQCTWLTVCTIALFSAWGTYAMAHNALGYEMSDDFNDRTRIFAIKSVYSAVMAVFGGYFYWFAIEWGKGIRWPLKYDGWQHTLALPSLGIDWPLKLPAWDLGVVISLPSAGGEINAIRMISMIVACVILFSGLYVAFFCRERFAGANRKHVDLWRACKAAISCRPFLILILLQTCRGLGAVCGPILGLVSIYYVCRGDKSQAMAVTAGLGGILGVVFAFILWPLAKPLTQRIGKKWGVMIGVLAWLATSIIAVFITKPGWIYAGVIMGLVFALPNMIGNLFFGALMPDICDIDELSSGERREGLFASVQSCLSKWENSLCGFLGMWLVHFSGFDPNLTVQPPVVLQKMLWFGFAPPILFAVISLMIAWKIPITEKLMNEVQAQLQARRAEAANKGF